MPVLNFEPLGKPFHKEHVTGHSLSASKRGPALPSMRSWVYAERLERVIPWADGSVVGL